MHLRTTNMRRSHASCLCLLSSLPKDRLSLGCPVAWSRMKSRLKVEGWKNWPKIENGPRPEMGKKWPKHGQKQFLRHLFPFSAPEPFSISRSICFGWLSILYQTAWLPRLRQANDCETPRHMIAFPGPSSLHRQIAVPIKGDNLMRTTAVCTDREDDVRSSCSRSQQRSRDPMTRKFQKERQWQTISEACFGEAFRGESRVKITEENVWDGICRWLPAKRHAFD